MKGVGYPALCSSRLYQMAKERGYPGGPDHFRHVVARIRPRRKVEAFLRLRVLIGEQAQADRGSFGKLTIGKALRALWAFVMVLCWSRQIFVRFYLSAAMPSFVRGHVDAFNSFGVQRTPFPLSLTPLHPAGRYTATLVARFLRQIPAGLGSQQHLVKFKQSQPSLGR